MALLYFTGSKSHNIALRGLANERGWKLNEYGLFDGNRRIAGATEVEIYKKLGLEYVPPELREDRGEVQLSREHRLPDLIDLGDIRCDLHAHTDCSDGTASIAEMATAAKARGYEYLAITDHSRRVTVAHGLDSARLSRQIRVELVASCAYLIPQLAAQLIAELVSQRHTNSEPDMTLVDVFGANELECLANVLLVYWFAVAGAGRLFPWLFRCGPERLDQLGRGV